MKDRFRAGCPPQSPPEGGKLGVLLSPGDHAVFRAGLYSASGSQTVNVVPWSGVLSTVTFPPC
jgi:hypothetical protein